MEKDNTLKTYITTFIVVILALAFLVSIATQTNTATTKTNVVDESYNLSGIGCYQGGQVNGTADPNCNITVTYAPTGWRSEDCPLTSVVLTNTTGTALTVTTDYVVFTSTGVIQLKNTTSTNVTNMGNNVLIDYSYCGDGYVNSSWGRTLLGTNVGMYALAILIVVIAAVVYLLGKKRDDD